MYRDILRELNRGAGGLGLAARETKKNEVRVLFAAGSHQIFVDNIRELMEAGKLALKKLRKGQLPDDSFRTVK